MSEMTSIVEQHQQQSQQYVAAGASSASDKLSCKDCGMNFDSSSSLEVHLRYHQENLMSQWASQGSQQDESIHNNNNNTSKAGNHNSAGAAGGGSHVSAGTPKQQRDATTAPVDSSEPSSRPPSEGPVSAARLQQQHQEQQHQHQLHQQQQHHQQQSFGQSFATLFTDPSQYYMSQEDYLMSSHYSPDTRQHTDGPASGPMRHANYSRYHPYTGQSCGPGTVVNPTTSPRSPPLQCDKCGAIFEDTNQLSEHVRTNHPASPASNSYPAPVPTQQQQPPQQPAAPQPTPQYQQLAGSPQQVAQPQQSQAQTQQQQMHASPPHAQQNQQQQMGHQSYDFSSGVVIKTELKTEPEEQAEILDLDSHKVQTHRFDEEYMRMQQQQQQQEMHMQLQHQAMQQHQSRGAPLAVPPMINWPAVTQAHEYHNELSPMGPMTSVSPIQDQQNQFMRGQPPHMPPQVEPPRHPGSPIITTSQPMPGPLPSGLMTQNPKPPPLSSNQSWKSNEARRPKTYNCTACNKWFTSSGHLKRHYNTTLHKNAVKQSNQPDPANMPISAHHHPARDRGGASATRNSPELSSSSSPPNLMAGPSGEATRGLLQTPTNTTSTAALFNSNNSNSSNSNEAIQVQSAMGQKCLEQQQAQHQQQQHLQQQQPSPSTGTLVPQPLNSMGYPSSPGLSPMGQPQQLQSPPQQHHLHQIGSPSHQQQLVQPHQHRQSHHHIVMASSLPQIGGSAQHTTTSPMSPMQQHHQLHMNSPSPMGSVVHHPMNSPSPTMSGPGQSMMASPPSGSMMGGTSMPHQPYPNALPPHVTTITSIPGLLESITNPQTTIGNDLEPVSLEHSEMLPSFGSFISQDQNKPLPSFEQFGEIANGFIVGQNHSAINVGGLGSPGENIPPQEYMMFRDQYDCISDMHLMTSTDGNIMINTHYTELQNKNDTVLREHQEQIMQQQHQPQEPLLEQQNVVSIQKDDQNSSPEKNNNDKNAISKEGSEEKGAKKKTAPRGTKRKAAREPRVISTKPHFISENGLHKCIECDKTFNKACYLTQHNKSFHSGDKPFKCNLCGKRFSEEPQHAEHLRKHAGDKPHKCEVCPKEFNHKTDLRRHSCLHSGEKPFNCTKCGKGFIRKDHMMKHLDTHRRKELLQNAKNLRT